MNEMIVVGGILALMVAVVVIFFLKKGSPTYSYKLKEFLTQNEKDLFAHLVKIYPDKYIAPQVSMGALLEPNVAQDVKNREGKSVYHSMWGSIKSNRIDFVVLDSQFNPEFIIELDDNSHNGKESADQKRDQNFKEVGIPTVRFRRGKKAWPNREFFEKNRV